MRRRSHLVAAAGLALLALQGCADRPPARPAAAPYNLLLVTLDTVRADRLGAYGYAAAETPALDALARDGVRFEQAVSAAPLTLPSHATLLSGVLPPQHALRNNGAGVFPAATPTLATALAGAGYRTGAFVGAFVLDRRFGLARGFELYDDEVARDPAAPAAGLEAERSGAEVVDRALAWLAREDGRPFFAWVHLYDAHAPYVPPEPYRSRHPGRPYDAEIAAVDAQVGRLLAQLDASGARQRTIVAVVADHGEALGEHGEPTHGLLLYEPTLRVPLLLRAPGLLPAGWVVREPVGLADLAPTLAALLDRPLVAESPAAGSRLAGRDLAPALRERREPPRADLYSESEYPRTFGWAGLAALRRGSGKYIAAPRPELFDLAADPGESRNLLAPEAPPPADLAARLAALRVEAPAGAAPAAADAETRARLASLGYLGIAPAPQRPGVAAADPKDRVELFRGLEESRAALAAGRVAEAATRLAALVAADPDNPVFRSTLGEALRREGDPARALPLYRRVVATTPADPQAWYNLAVALQEAGQVDEAAAALAEAIHRDDAHPEAHNTLGVVRTLRGDVAAARAAFARAVELDPRSAVAWNNLGNALRQLGRPAEAEAAYRRAVALAPRYSEPWNGLGALEVERDRPAAALPCFERALALAPRLHEARFNRAIALEMLGDRGPAIDAYREFLAAAKDDPQFAAQRRAARQLLGRLGAGAAT